MTHGDKGHLEIEDHGSVLIVRVDGGPHGLFGLDIANQLEELVDRVDRTQASMPSSSPGRIPSGSLAMLTSGGCKKRVPRFLRWADAAPPRRQHPTGIQLSR